MQSVQGALQLLAGKPYRLRNQPFGEVLMLVTALGLAVFGIYGLCEARWRRV